MEPLNFADLKAKVAQNLKAMNLITTVKLINIKLHDQVNGLLHCFGPRKRFVKTKDLI